MNGDSYHVKLSNGHKIYGDDARCIIEGFEAAAGEVATLRAENERLRAAVAEREGVWAALNGEHPPRQWRDDGRGPGGGG
jgi:hypothetical protein